MNSNQFYSQKQSASKISIKAIILVGIVLILWIPLAIITDNAKDRERLDSGVEGYFGSKYNEAQDVSIYLTVECTNADSSTTSRYLTPSKLDIKGDIKSQYIKKGRFDVLTYLADIEYSATVSLSKLLSNPDRYGTANLSTATIVAFNNRYNSPISSKPVFIATDGQTATFNDKLSLRGSDAISFKIAGSGSISLKGDWANPNFSSISNELPDTRTVTETGFDAMWNINEAEESYIYSDIYSSSTTNSYGVKLIVDVSQYQMVIRTTKYGILIILFTFVSFFLAELWCKRSINIFQYLLAGFALILFYLLLLSVSEYLRFAYAYFIASAITLGFIMLYLFSVLCLYYLVVIFLLILSNIAVNPHAKMK